MESLFPPLPEWFWYPICFLYGSIVGSFLNVLIYRLPLMWEDKSVSIGGQSFCPRCRNYLKPYHNVPLLGFLFLRGRCAFCKVRISWRYFTVELLTGCLWVALYHVVSGRSGVSWIDFVGQALFASVLVAMIFIDLDHFIAPDELNVTATVIAVLRDAACLALAWFAGRYVFDEFAPQFLYWGWMPRFVLGALAYGGVLFLVSFFSFLYYARGETETLPSVVRRFFTHEDWAEPTPLAPAADAPPAPDEADEDEPEGEPVRLQFSPGFLAVASALLLASATGAWAVLAFVVPLVAFVALSRVPGEGAGGAVARFFSSDDQRGVPDDGVPVPAHEIAPDLSVDELYELAENDPGALTSAQRETLLKFEADAFAVEAEKGTTGGMGLGDVKLAVAIGALLGPGLALLSLFFATLLGAVTGLFLMVRHRRGNARLAVPFVPFMAAGAILVMLFGSSLIEWYLVFSGIKPRPEEPTPPRIVRPRPPLPSPPQAP